MNISESLATGIGVKLSEALSFGGLTTLLGMVIVFAVLVILMVVLYLFKVIFYKEPKMDVQEKNLDAAVTTPIVNTSDAAYDENELIAVMTAAIAASLNTSTYNLKIKSYRRADNKRSEWNKQGLRETISNRL